MILKFRIFQAQIHSTAAMEFLHLVLKPWGANNIKSFPYN